MESSPPGLFCFSRPLGRLDVIRAQHALEALWRLGGLLPDALPSMAFTGQEPALPSSFALGTALQASLGAAALAGAESGWERARRAGRGSARQGAAVDMGHAVAEALAHHSIDGRVPEVWDPLSGLYPCGPEGEQGWVRIHANFAHHRDGALRLLGLAAGAGREQVKQALGGWRALDFEAAAADAGLVVAALRSFEEWDRHPQAQAVRARPVLHIERIDGAPDAPPLHGPAPHPDALPLHGLRVLDLTRILAGPVAGRTLATLGADVMLVNSPRLPNIAVIADTSRGKLSVHLDLKSSEGRAVLRRLLADAHVFMQAYRPGALTALGLGPAELARLRPGIVCVSLSAYGDEGPWAGRRGFDSLVQTATGFNHAEAAAAGSATPRAFPLQALDFGAAHLLAFGAQAALWRQQREGGSWLVRVSLAGVGQWLRSLGRLPHGFAASMPDPAPWLESMDSGFGRLVAVSPAIRLAGIPLRTTRPSMPPGSHPPVWPAAEAG